MSAFSNNIEYGKFIENGRNLECLYSRKKILKISKG